MKTQIYLAVFFISITTLHAQTIQTTWSEQTGTLGVIGSETFTSEEMDFDVKEALSFDKPSDLNWGIKGTLLGTDSYIKLKILYGGKTLLAIKYNSSGNSYSHESLFYECVSSVFEYPIIFDQPSPCDDNLMSTPFWESNDFKKIYLRLKKKQPESESELKSITLNNKVTLVLEVKNATVQEIYIPGLGKPKTPRMLFTQRKGVVVYVDRDNESAYYDFTVASSDNSASKAFGLDKMVNLTAGDRVSYEVYGNKGNDQPTIKGVPKIWVTAYSAQREFITTPDYGPNQYEPWIAFEGQTHFRMINTYPESFIKSGIKTKDWEDRTLFKSWNWVAQRSTDPTLDKYEPVVYYPKTRKFFIDDDKVSYKYQRESQALGWSKQLMEYYDANLIGDYDLQGPYFEKTDNFVDFREKYLTGFDVDEFLYVGSKTAEAGDVSKWITDAKGEDQPYKNPGILSVHNYMAYPNFSSDQSTNNWQTLWDSEKNYLIWDSKSSDNNYTSVYCVPENSTFPMVWDSRGFPQFGFQLNDMVTRYQKYKMKYDRYPKTGTLPRDYYYNGYEIQDVASHYRLAGSSRETITKSLDGKPSPCAEDCWFDGNNGGANVQHPGNVSVTINTGVDTQFTVNFKQKVTDPINNNSNAYKGFYSSLQAKDQWVMGWGNKNTWTLHGVTSEDMAKRISIEMLEYKAGDGMELPVVVRTYDTPDFDNPTKYLVYDDAKKTLSATFEVHNSWMAIVAYYKPQDGKDEDKVIIAGRTDMVMDPPTSLTVPGSNEEPYAVVGSGETLPEGSLDFKEGQGDRAFETMNEVRFVMDPGRGYVHTLVPWGDPIYTKYVREYNIVKGDQLTFSCLDVGRKIQSFWKNNNEDPYQSWREMAKRMPSAEAAKRLEWSVWEKQDDGTDPKKIYTKSYDPEANKSDNLNEFRHFTYEFQEAGNYEVRVTWANAPKFIITKVLITVVESPGDYTNLNNNVERGKIGMRPLSIEEKRWIKDNTKAYEGDKAELNSLDSYMVAEVHDIFSYYAYNLGPRASGSSDNKVIIHREGLRRDFNDVFEWYSDSQGSTPSLQLPDFVKEGNKGFLSTNINTALWPESWGKTWLYHNPNKGTTAPVTNSTGVLKDGFGVNQASFTSTMDEAFTNLGDAQSTLPWIRWFPWIAISPTNGYKFNRYIKTVMDINKFVTNEGLGLFSGKIKTKTEEVTNAIENTRWFDYGSPEAISATEFDRHLSDDKKNLMEFYNDLKYGRKIIFKPGANSFPPVGEGIVVKNVNPKRNSEDSSKPDRIYIAGATIEGLPTTPTHLPGIPLLTFDGARKDKNDLNNTYTVTGGKASIVYQGGNPYLKIVADDGWNSIPNEPIKLEVNIPQALVSPVGAGTTRFAPTPIINGCKVSLKHGGEGILKVRVSAFHGFTPEDYQHPWKVITHNVEGSNFQEFSNPLIDSSIPLSKILIEIDKEENPNIASPVLYVDNIHLTTITDVPSPFVPPIADSDFLRWLGESAYRFFDWNYKEINLYNEVKAVFLESTEEVNIDGRINPMAKVSLSGQGMGIATTLLAAKAGYITEGEAKRRIEKVLKWLEMVQNNSKGADASDIPSNIARVGWHGMPSHYFSPDGNIYNPGRIDSPAIAVSTIDWAICAQGIRLARQYYSTDEDIRLLTTKLLFGVNWNRFVMPPDGKEKDGKPFHNGGRIAFDLSNNKGTIDKSKNAWGESFSEETELVYLEVLAYNAELRETSYNSFGEGKYIINMANINIDKVIYQDASGRNVKVIDRKCKDGFIPSYFGSGFTYNWLQLWYGSKELSSLSYNSWGLWGTTKYYYNSQKAYQVDYDTAQSRFGNPYMGLTAVSTISSIAPNGFVAYNNYLGKQGSDTNLAPQGQVVQLAPAPYGAALVLPFQKEKAMEAFRAYAGLGYRHQYMGLPESLVLQGTGDLGPLPNWNQTDLNMASIAMAIDQMGDNKYIANLLVKDTYAMKALYALYTSFSSDYNACPAAMGSGKVDTEDKQVEIGPVTQEEALLLEDNILLYPNPNTGDFTLRFSINKPGVYEGDFMDLQERVIRHDRWEFSSAGSHDVVFKGLRQKGLSPGLYFMVVKGNGIKKTIKVMVRN